MQNHSYDKKVQGMKTCIRCGIKASRDGKGKYLYNGSPVRPNCVITIKPN